ncbi:Uncharacterised protein [Porphyromonas macacae]|uniref:Uncharacterized protein n=1 Tax=Porphyromonas macacae TaxID=28115 RepID=A0A379DG94_9PORP|nr:Uncharacterised protein [Porphyromonas macacae]
MLVSFPLTTGYEVLGGDTKVLHSGILEKTADLSLKTKKTVCMQKAQQTVSISKIIFTDKKPCVWYLHSLNAPM